MSVLFGKRTNAANTITIVGLFLFSVGAFNLPGQIFFALTLYFFIWKSKTIVIEKHDVILLLFSTSYFVIYTFNFGFAVKSLIIYLWGPWAAYLFGKWFVLSDNSDRSFQEMTNTLTFGFFLHGVLNLLAYLKSDYYAQYAYQRVSVDFWRGDMVSVISTGFMFTFAVALSTSILFSHCGVLNVGHKRCPELLGSKKAYSAGGSIDEYV